MVLTPQPLKARGEPAVLGPAVLAGVVVGALHHKNLGLSDGDKARITVELNAGKAAVAVMAKSDTVSAISDKLTQLGGTSESTAEKNAIAYATSKGVLVIAAAGNSGSKKVGCPACDANAISVAATTWQDARAAYAVHLSSCTTASPSR